MSDLGQMIKDRREAAGLSQKRLGNVCGLSDSEIMKIENGTRKTPNWENLCKIAQALHFHPFELLLAAGYISKEDIHPLPPVSGLEHLNEGELNTVQLFVDFMLSRKSQSPNTEGGYKKCSLD